MRFIVLVLLVAGAVGLGAHWFRGHRLLSVQTASMLPAIRPGDALVIEPVSPARLRIGDIISYRNPRHPGMIITHRLIAIDRRTGWLTTAGDKLRTTDPVFPPSLVTGRATGLAPGLGGLLDALRRPLGLALAVYLPAALFIAAEVRRLSRIYARPFYSARL